MTLPLEEFVRAAGTALGAAQDLYGTGAAGEIASPATAPPAPGGLVPGRGRAVEASTAASGQLHTHATVLSENDASTHSQLANMVAAHNSGRARMNSTVSAATADVSALAPATTTPQGQRAMVSALTQHLQNTKQTLQDSSAVATTHAASAHTTADAYQTVAQSPTAVASSASPAAAGTSMAPMPMAGLSGLPGLVGSPDGTGGQGTDQRKSGTTAGDTGSSAIDAVVARALSQHGTPYVWGGGGPHGPTNGGFDCSSLMQYAFAGAGVDLPRTTYQQIGLGHAVSPGDIRPGDLIFTNFGEGGTPGPGHVQLAISPTHVVEAPHTGANVRTNVIPAGNIVVRRLLS
jgi:cell wall-associated NlpC family hydrolase